MIKKISSLLLTLLLVVAVATPVMADGLVTGSVTASNAAPTITSVTLQATGGDGGSINSMTPLTEYWVEIVAADNNTIDDIERIDIYIFYDSNGAQDGIGDEIFDCDENAVFKWVKSGGTWSMEVGDVTSTTWVLGTTNVSVTPGDMEVTEGEWNLSFVPGKLAVEAAASGGAVAEWDIYVKVTDGTAATAENTEKTKAMTAYSQIAMDPATIDFGTLALGATAAITTPADHTVSTNIIANDAHAVGVMSAGTWVIGEEDSITLDTSGTPDAAGEFGLIIDDNATDGIPTEDQAVTDSNVTIAGHAADDRTETADNTNEVTTDVDLYMSLELYNSGIDIGEYSGTITFSVTN